MLLRSWSLFALLAGGAACLPAAVLYTVTDIGTLGGASTDASAINDAGQITGRSFTGGGDFHTFLYSNGVMTDLGTLPGGVASIGYGINNAGQIVGASYSADYFQYAFLYSNGVMTSLGTPLAGVNILAFGINDAGQVTGNSGSHAFLYSNGAVADLGTLGGTYSTGYGINKAGQITGSSRTVDGYSHAFLYSSGVMTDLGTLPSTDYSSAGSINDAGQIVGYSYTDTYIDGRDIYSGHAFLYSNGLMTDLGTLGGRDSSASSINNAGQITGGSRTASDAAHAFLYSNGAMTDLNSLIDPNLRITLTSAGPINNLGQIVAYDNRRSYLLTPVPEPGTWALLGAGLLLITVLARSYTK